MLSLRNKPAWAHVDPKVWQKKYPNAALNRRSRRMRKGEPPPVKPNLRYLDRWNWPPASSGWSWSCWSPARTCLIIGRMAAFFLLRPSASTWVVLWPRRHGLRWCGTLCSSARCSLSARKRCYFQCISPAYRGGIIYLLVKGWRWKDNIRRYPWPLGFRANSVCTL